MSSEMINIQSAIALEALRGVLAHTWWLLLPCALMLVIAVRGAHR
jgi:hypothetical protein